MATRAILMKNPYGIGTEKTKPNSSETFDDYSSYLDGSEFKFVSVS